MKDKTHSVRVSSIFLSAFAIAGIATGQTNVKTSSSNSAASLQTRAEHSSPLPSIVTAYTGKYGTAANDSVTGISTDVPGNVYLAGNTVDTEASGFLRKYSPAGVLLWAISKSKVSIDGVTIDKDGNAYICGAYEQVAWPQNRHYVYLEKYNGDGNIVWTKSLAAAPASDPTRMIANGIATDPRGNNFIIMLFERAFWPYQTRQVFIRKYNVAGTPVWEKPVGNSSPYTPRPVLAVSNNGTIYTAVNSIGNMRWNTTISRFDAQGEPVWTTGLQPTPTDFISYVHGIATDPSNNICVSGITKGGLEGQNLGSYDAFVRKYDTAGIVQWTRQFGTAAADYAYGLTTDAAGNILVAGSSSGNLFGNNLGSSDAVILRYASNGDVLKTRQYGTNLSDSANCIRIDAAGNLHVAGHTYGNLGGSPKGGQDVYFRKYSSFN